VASIAPLPRVYVVPLHDRSGCAAWAVSLLIKEGA